MSFTGFLWCLFWVPGCDDFGFCGASTLELLILFEWWMGLRQRLFVLSRCATACWSVRFSNVLTLVVTSSRLVLVVRGAQGARYASIQFRPSWCLIHDKAMPKGIQFRPSWCLIHDKAMPMGIAVEQSYRTHYLIKSSCFRTHHSPKHPSQQEKIRTQRKPTATNRHH